MLAFAHGGRQDLERQAEVGLRERSEDDERMFDVEGQVVEQLRIRIGLGLERGQGGLHLVEDHLLPVRRVDDDEGPFEPGPVGREVRGFDRAGSGDPVADRLVAGREAFERRRDGPAAEDAEQSVDGTGETERARGPAHHLGERERAQDPRHGRGEDVGRRRALGLALEAEIFALGRPDGLEEALVDALGPGKALAGRAQGAVGPLGDGERRPCDDLLPVLLAFGEIARDDEAARRRQGPERADLDAGAEELLAEPGLELFDGGADVRGRKLLRPKLEQEFHQAPSFPPV